jgi:non-specific serine/threonine protein kinase
MAAAANGRLYVLGGYGRSRAKLRGAWVLTSGGRWRALPPLPAPRAAGGAAVVRGRLYVAGGVGPAGLARQTFVLDLRRRRWSTLPGPTPREHLAVTAAAGRLYALAGRKAGFDTNTTIFESLAPPARRWRGLPPVPSGRGGTGAAVVGTTIVSVGGEAPEGTIAKVFAFDVPRRTWRRLPDLPTPRHGLAVAAVAGRVYAIAGGTTPGLATSGVNEFLSVRAVRSGRHSTGARPQADRTGRSRRPTGS